MIVLIVACIPLFSCMAQSEDKYPKSLFNDSHFHLTNYIQKGITTTELLTLMEDKVGRVALFGLPLQQKWDHFVTKDRAPAYYLHSDASMYYYSFNDAMIAEQYRKLTPEQKNRFDPMISGFNPTDMYATDHIRRVLKMYPGVFSGIGEFSVHKEFVSAKISGHTASLHNKALNRTMELAGEVGLIALIHCDINTVRSPQKRPVHFDDMKKIMKAHRKTTIIWAHTGLGRFVKPTVDHVELLLEILKDKEMSHVYFDISWDEVTQYIVGDAASLKKWADMITAYPDRFLFGTDCVAPKTQEKYLGPYHACKKLWDVLDKKTSFLIRKGNHIRLFDAANKKIRAWEAANATEKTAKTIE